MEKCRNEKPKIINTESFCVEVTETRDKDVLVNVYVRHGEIIQAMEFLHSDFFDGDEEKSKSEA